MESPRLQSLEEIAAIARAARVHHYEGELMTVSFWKKAAASLPPASRRRYAHLFEAAERYEPVVDLLVDAWRDTRRPLARGFHAAAGALRSAAGSLDEAARRLTLHR